MLTNFYLFVCTTELDDLRFVCGDEEAEADEETIGDGGMTP